MRVVHVTPTYLPAIRYGGPIFAVHGLCRALAARGHTVSVLTTSVDGPGDSPVRTGAPVMLDGVEIRYFSSDRLRRLYFAPELGRALGSAVAQADVVHLHSVFLWPTWAAARSARRHRVPYLISPRGMLVRKLIAQRRRLIKSAWIALIERSNLEHAAAVHVTSAAEAAELDEFGFRLARVAVIPNGIDAPLTPPVDEPAADIAALRGSAAPLILYFGRLSWVKNLDHLLRAFARTRVGMLAIVGTDEDRMAPHLAKLAHDLAIADRVRIVARTVQGADKEAAFAAARVLVLPSRSESFGNTVLEALWRGVPAIVTAGVGAGDIVRASGGGLIVEEDDPDALAAALERLALDPAAARAMGEAGRAHVRAQCGWPAVAARMEALYASVRG